MAKKILAIASGGGHWVQMCRLYPVFSELDVAFVSVHPTYAKQVEGHRYYVIRDVSRLDRWGIFKLLPQLVRIIWIERPDVVITTGSAPALIAIAIAKVLVHAKGIWIDSIANSEKLSVSGSLARYVADIWLTQWPQLKSSKGPEYWGAVL